MGRRLGVVLVLVLLVAVLTPANARAATANWVRPVPGAVTRPFDPPRSRFGSGHLGADISASAASPVRAAGPGVVSFAGIVARSLHVVVAHAGNLRTSYSFLATIAVRRGQVVEAGEIVGTTGGLGQSHNGAVLHFALRTGDTYVDPMALFGTVDLVSVVHLVPTSDPPHPAPSLTERRGILAGFAHDLGTVAGVVARAAGVAARSAKGVVERQFPLAAAVARAEAAYLAQHCDSHAPPANGEGGSGHRVMVVAGIESSLTGSTSSLGLDTAALGYHADEVANFSYAKDGGDYVPTDTEGPLLRAAHYLAGQLRAMQRAEPGREVDLIAHSQGGVVVEAFLTQIYKAGDATYPPIGSVITLSSPLQGDPLASAVAAVNATETGRAAMDGFDSSRQALAVPPVKSAAVRDLARGSDFMKKLEHAKLPTDVQLTAIGAATDFIVPANSASRSGAQSTTVIPRSLNGHTGIVTDSETLRNMRAALEGRPLPCRSLTNEVIGEVVPTAIGGLEAGIGVDAAIAARVTP
jgi:triacylglycerol esterase/lipase EstA (alpha/beta hydrolase family)